MNKVEVFSLNKAFEKETLRIKKVLIKALKLLKKDNLYLEVFLISDQKMRFLNKKYKKKDKATNVLAFSFKNFPLAGFKLKPLGEIYLAPAFIFRNKQDIYYLAIHGLLHLLGYTHFKKSDKLKMEKKEKWLNYLLR